MIIFFVKRINARSAEQRVKNGRRRNILPPDIGEILTYTRSAKTVNKGEKMGNKDDFKILIINESDGASIISDIFSYSLLMGGFFINRFFLGDSLFIQVFIGLVFLMGIHKRASKKIKHVNAKEALEYLTEHQSRNSS